MMEPDFSNVDAARSWLDSRYPNSNNQTGSPLYQYLNDEIAKGHRPNELRRRETHLSTGEGGEFLKFVFENSGDDTVNYKTMRDTIFPVKDYPEFRVQQTPDTSEDDSPEPECTKKWVGSEEAKIKSERSLHNAQSAPNHAQRPRRKPRTLFVRTHKVRVRTLRPRRNGKVHKTA